MSHDLTAEYDAYVAEHSRYVAAGRTERAEQVRAEMARVRGQIEVQAARHTADAEEFETKGQDVLAARARIRARELRQHLETTAQSMPLEQAASKKQRGA